MYFFVADYYFKSVTDISFEFLKRINKSVLFLDIDNTIKKYGDIDISEDIRSWMQNMTDRGIDIILCSNNYKSNVKAFAENLNLKFVSMCLKPSPFGYIRAFLKTKAKRKNILICGDQIFTDIFGARILFLKCALVEPIDISVESKTVSFRRRLFRKQKNLTIKKYQKLKDKVL